MELRHLRYFVAVAEEQNVTRAAARLHVSQPPLSRQIRYLEDELGVALFEHSAKAVRLTEAGRVFLAEAGAVVQRADEAVQTVRAVASGQRGEIHVGYRDCPCRTEDASADSRWRLWRPLHRTPLGRIGPWICFSHKTSCNI